jgi:hypothetical protein
LRETELVNLIRLKASKMGWRLFRNNTGVCRQGKRFIRYGLFVGSSDLIGFTDKGRFVAIEVKVNTPTTDAQKRFLCAVINAGGIGIIAHSVDDLTACISDK